jgi:ankyrin repeat protein
MVDLYIHKSYIFNFCAGFIQKGVIMKNAICLACAMLLIIIGNTTGDCAQDDNGLRLIDAVLEGNRQVVEKSLKDGVPVDAENEQGETALIWACFKGDETSVRLLLSKGANPTTVAKSGMTPIIAAVSFGHTEIVKTLLSRLNLDAITVEQILTGHTVATEKGYVETATLLQKHLESKTSANRDAKSVDNSLDALVVQACSVGDIKAAKRLLEEGAKIDGDGTQEGITPLFVAVAGGHQEVANLLLEKGADVNVGVKENWTPFIACCHYGRSDLAEKLIEKGADVDARTEDGWSGL